MAAIDLFNDVWNRSDAHASIHTYLVGQTTAALNIDELLRAEWVARVSALDLYVHELVATRMREIFEGLRPAPPAYSKFQLPMSVVNRIQNAASLSEASAAFDLEIRQRHSTLTFQDPEKIADAIRLISTVELWNGIAIHQGATAATKEIAAKDIKRSLSIIVQRRNKIAHEGDLQPAVPRTPWPIARTDVTLVVNLIRGIVLSMEAVIT